MKFYRTHVLVCGNADCQDPDKANLVQLLEQEIIKEKLQDEVKVTRTGTLGKFDLEPMIIVYPEKTIYANVTDADVAELVQEHFLKGRIVERLVCPATGMNLESVNSLDNYDFYKKQVRIAMRNCGVIDPTSIDEYIGLDGYAALGKVLTEMTPEQVIKEIEVSGIRGRGGSGFPTAKKWTFAHDTKASQKYIVCNADEGDLGAFMDRGIIEGDPHSVIEAMAIAGYAVGASQGYIYCRIEYPLAIERFTTAINQAKEYGLLGENIFESGFNFNVEVRLGAGAYVCGEETALISSLEGKRGEPKLRPPFPPICGLNGKPTVLNNVETLANIPAIILKGGVWYSSIGSKNCTGTKVFALGGKVANAGLIEVPMGTTLREIIYDMGGGIPNDKKYKGVLTSGGYIPIDKLDMPLDYDTMREIGSMLGSGGLVVLDEDDCVVDITRFLMEFMVEESCGKCTACRIGNTRLFEILERIVNGKGEDGDIDKLIELSNTVKEASFCGLGQFAPNPILDTIKYFRPEYEAHIKEHRCVANSCKLGE